MNGLLSERCFEIDGGRWVVERHWDLTNPRCPMFLSPFHSQLGAKDIYIEQRVITETTYRELFGLYGHATEGDRCEKQ